MMSVDLLDAIDALEHDDALRLVRRLHLRFPCLTHQRTWCRWWRGNNQEM